MEQLIFNDHFHNILMIERAFEFHFIFSEFDKIKKYQTSNMIEMFPHFFHRETCFRTNLAINFLCFNSCYRLLFFHVSTSLTKILIFWRYRIQTITSQMKTCVTIVTVKNLIWIIVIWTKTYFAIGFKKLFIWIASWETLWRLWVKVLFVLNVGFKHFLCLIFETMFKRSHDCWPR